MARGNMGNLLQHFIALRCAEALLAYWNKPAEPILYVDCFSMAPWEPVPHSDAQGFTAAVEGMGSQRRADIVAQTFMTAWERRHAPAPVPTRVRDRAYPNTAVLLRTAFPAQAWNMRLHDTDAAKRSDLKSWAAKQAPGDYAAHANWLHSPLLAKMPAPLDRSVFVMLDPYQIVEDKPADKPSDEDQKGDLPERHIRYLFRSLALDLIRRPSQRGAAPALITLFSYCDRDPVRTHQMVCRQFEPDGWTVEHVSSGPWNCRGSEAHHLGWVVSCGLPKPLLGVSLQQAWDDWLE